MIFQGDFAQRDQEIYELLHGEDNFDIIRRHVLIGGKKACWYTIDGFLKGDLMEKVMEYLGSLKPEDMPENFGDL